MKDIASFQVDHTILTPGLYFSRADGPVHTFDLRLKKPNTGDRLTNTQLHSVEHLIATLLRNSEQRDSVVYFGPMGCQTGFYFLFDSRTLPDAAGRGGHHAAAAGIPAGGGVHRADARRICRAMRQLPQPEPGRGPCGLRLVRRYHPGLDPGASGLSPARVSTRFKTEHHAERMETL